MKRRLSLAVGLSVVLLATLMPAAADARIPARAAARTQRVSLHGRQPRLGRLPSQQARNRLVDVAVELKGSPVARYDAAAADRGAELSSSRKAAIRRLLGSRRAVVEARLRGLGARIRFRYTDVFNGVRIRVRARKVDAIARLPGVKAVLPVPHHTRDNLHTVPYLRADRTWGQTGFTGKGVSIAIIDTGINYYHLDFGGAGFKAFKDDDPTIREPGTFPTAKVVDGWDLVGDDYDADDPFSVPNPDPDPLDCKDADAATVQHGTHVAGTAAGFGVTTAGKTYTGPYDAGTLASTHFRIGPGVAPRARLMAFRVFGCAGSTAVIVDALEMAVQAGADVINMSLGSPFGSPDSLDSVASDNAVLAGVTVVSSGGNEGPSAYMAGAPGVARRVIAVGAMDAQPGFPAATIDMASGPDVDAVNANNAHLPVSGKVVYFKDDPGTDPDPDTGAGDESLGCHGADYAYNGLSSGQIAVVQRGGCARTDKAKMGQKKGAAAVVMVNDEEGLPPYENAIGGVTIPFIGVDLLDDPRFDANDGKAITINGAGTVGNAEYQHSADFTSGGPRRLDSAIKPDVTAPGVGVYSAWGATTAQGQILSGTSMASPAVAGVAALVQSAHPTWQPRDIKAAIIGTAAPSRVKPYDQRLSGAGVASPRRAVDTVAFVYTDPGQSSLTFGARSGAFSQTRTFSLRNTSRHAITYHLSNAPNGPSRGLDVSIVPSTVTVPARSDRGVKVTITLGAADAAALPDMVPGHGPPVAYDDAFQLYTPLTTVAGAIVASPTTSRAGEYPLRVPWMVVPRGESRVQDVPATRAAWTTSGSLRKSSVKIRNYGTHRGIADFYAWGLTDGYDGLDGIDLRAAGVQSDAAAVCDPSAAIKDRCLIFAINTWGQWSNVAENEFDVAIDVDKDGDPDFLVAGIDLGYIFDGEYNGVEASIVFDLHTETFVDAWLGAGGVDGSTLLLPLLASDLGLKGSGDTDFDYWVESLAFANDSLQADIMLTGDSGTGTSPLARFDAFDPAINNGQFKKLASAQVKRFNLVVDTAGYKPKRGMKGWLVVTLEDAPGRFGADFLPVGALP